MRQDLGGEGGWDVITINFGIHDCCAGGDGRTGGRPVQQAEYIKNLDAVYQVARSALAPDGKIVWVSTTQHGTGCDAASAATCNRWGNFSQCIEDYNNAAAVLWASRPDVITADLHGLVRNTCGDSFDNCNLQLWDNVHPTEAGKQFYAIHIAKVIAPLLGPKWARLVPRPGD